MGKLKDVTMKYSYNDIMVKPAILSTIEHRSECNPFDENGMLPLFTAPMDSVVNINNFGLFEKNGIIPILPRTEDIKDRLSFIHHGKWAALSLDEFERYFTKSIDVGNYNKKIYVLIDIANGHVSRLYEAVRAAKGIFRDSIVVMVGNIANPETYRVCVESHVDYVRCSIGTGCFHPDSVVKTDKGDVPIKDIKIGDSVLTHKNRFKKVLNTKKEKSSDNLLVINGKVKCTKDHRFYVINKVDKDKVNDENVEKYAYWVEAKDLDKNKHLLIKI